jgi:hypothetical protein
MNISEARNKYLFTTKIELPHEEEAEEEDIDYVVLREPTVDETRLFSKDENDTKKNLDTLKILFPKCLVEHSFVTGDLTPAKNEEVHTMLRESSSLYSELIDTWFKSIPFQSRLRKQPK